MKNIKGDLIKSKGSEKVDKIFQEMLRAAFPRTFTIIDLNLGKRCEASLSKEENDIRRFILMNPNIILMNGSRVHQKDWDIF